MFSLSKVIPRAGGPFLGSGYRILKKGCRDINPAPFLDSILDIPPGDPGCSLPEQLLLLAVIGFFVPFAEALDASGGIDDLLLPREERVAVGADFDVEFFLGRTGLDHVAAKAGDGAVHVFGMYILLHGPVSLYFQPASYFALDYLAPG
jgi:hypothetical protein